MLGNFIRDVLEPTLGEEDRPRDQRKSLITQEIMKGTYRQKQNLGRQHGSGSPHQKGDEGLIYAAPRNTGDL